jgi:phage major head subunit gpT-like protein
MKKELQPNLMRATIAASTFNEEEKSVEVVAATGMKGLRRAWDGSYYEELSMESSNIRLDRLNAGASVLDSHSQYQLSDVLGKVEKAWIEGGELRAKVKFSTRENIAGIIQDIKDGIITNLSVGYRVYKYEKIEDAENKIPTMRAIDWEPFEISFVPVPFDYKATTRSEEQGVNEVEIIVSQINNRKMENETVNKPVEITQDDVVKAKAEAAGAERKRTSEILQLCQQAKLSDDFARTLIDKGETIEVSQRAIIAEFAKREEGGEIPGQHTEVTIVKDVAEKVRGGVELALSHRIGIEKDLKPEARDFRGMSLIRLAEEVLTAEGVKTKGMSQREIAQMSLGMSRSMSTSDFPNILGSLINKRLRADYEDAPQTFQPITRKTTASDFKTKNVLQLSGLVGSFEEVLEGGEYKAGKMTEYKEAYAVKKYGKKIIITWESLINDDMNAFTRIPSAIAKAARQKQSDIIWGIITANGVMADGHTLFKADHLNLANPATAITVAALGLARKAIRNQKSIEGTFINLQPKYLVVGPDKELEAQQFLSTNYVAAQNSTINPFAGALTLIVEPRLTGNQWYMMADPGMVDTIEYAFLEGEGELFTEQQQGFEVDGLEVKARMVFGAKAIDWRGMYKNAGA